VKVLVAGAVVVTVTAPSVPVKEGSVSLTVSHMPMGALLMNP
jgi:hypothetical protein